jgi:hypothetical protein
VIKKVLVVCVLDETGSMQPIQDRTMDCFNEYVQGLIPQGKMCHMTLIKFNSGKTETVCSNVPIKDVPKLTTANYQPNNMTPLYDAVGKAIADTEAALKAQKEKLDVLFVVLTDGQENFSEQYDQKKVAEMVKEKETVAGWTFVYLGANQDAWAGAASIGYSNAGNTMTWQADMDGVTRGFAVAAAGTNNYFSERNAFYTANTGSSAHNLTSIQANSLQYSKTDFLSDTAEEEIAKFEKKIKGEKKSAKSK